MESLSGDVMFQPWRGSRYSEGIGGRRVLVLGESHYHSCDNDPACTMGEVGEEHHRNLTHAVVDHWKDNPHRSPLSHRVPALFDMEKAEFWNRVAFYNFLQSFAGEHARDRPSAQQWDGVQSHRALQSVLDCLQPNRILVLGKKTWAYLPSSTDTLFRAPSPEPRLPIAEVFGQAHEVDRTAFWYSFRPDGAALAMPVVHPSSWGFAVADWQPTVECWMKFEPASPTFEARS